MLELILASSLLLSGSDSPTPYTVDGRGITLPVGEVFENNGHVNIKTATGSLSLHFEEKCVTRTDAECAGERHKAAQFIGKSYIPWSAFGLKGEFCVCWVQLSAYNEHFGEGGQEPICSPTHIPEEPPVTPEEPETPVTPPVDEPKEPTTPDIPEEPSTPETPETPGETTPEEPTVPVVPETPVKTPTEPSEPPVEPVVPSTPVRTPEKPVTPPVTTQQTPPPSTPRATLPVTGAGDVALAIAAAAALAVGGILLVIRARNV